MFRKDFSIAMNCRHTKIELLTMYYTANINGNIYHISNYNSDRDYNLNILGVKPINLGYESDLDMNGRIGAVVHNHVSDFCDNLLIDHYNGIDLFKRSINKTECKRVCNL